MGSAPLESRHGGEENEITAPLELQSLREGWAKLEARAPEWHAEVTFAAKTDLGRVRENNEDKFDFLEPEEPAVLAARGRFYAVCDGMGGHAAGQIASELALKSIIKKYYANTTDDLETALAAAVQYANALILDTAATIPGRSGMGTTFTGAILHEEYLIAAQVGDSRLYLFRDGEIRQITQDHSWVAEQIRLGVLDPESAARSPFRNVITRSLGAQESVEVDLCREKIRPGDVILLCSDGLTGHLDDQEIALLARRSAPSVACMELIDAANDRGGRDNITVLIIRVDAVKRFDPAAEPADPGEEPAPEAPPSPPTEGEKRRRFPLPWR